jgi:predicted restriction endonuclease
MKNHTKIYFSYFGYDISSFVPCEWCGKRSQDLHHIKARGMGGDPQGKRDVIENIMALCRECHHRMGDRKDWLDILQARHDEKLRLTSDKQS